MSIRDISKFKSILFRQVIVLFAPSIAISVIGTVLGLNLVYAVGLVLFVVLWLFALRNSMLKLRTKKRYFIVNLAAFSFFLLYEAACLLIEPFFKNIRYVSSFLYCILEIVKKAVEISTIESLILLDVLLIVTLILAPIGLEPVIELLNARGKNYTQLMEGNEWSYAKNFDDIKK